MMKSGASAGDLAGIVGVVVPVTRELILEDVWRVLRDVDGHDGRVRRFGDVSPGLRAVLRGRIRGRRVGRGRLQLGCGWRAIPRKDTGDSLEASRKNEIEAEHQREQGREDDPARAAVRLRPVAG